MSERLITRRAVLRAGALGAVAAAVPVTAIELVADRLAPVNTWGMAQFSKLVGTTFVIGGAGERFTLARVADLRGPRTGATECYALTFSGAPGAGLDGTQMVRHPSLGVFPMLLVDGGSAGGAQSYVAVVNRI